MVENFYTDRPKSLALLQVTSASKLKKPIDDFLQIQKSMSHVIGNGLSINSGLKK